MLSPKALSRAARLALLGFLLGACHGYDKDDDPPKAPYYDVWEFEPNSTHCCPNDLGWLAVGDNFVIGGTIRDDNADPFDGFLLRAQGPCTVRFVLEPLDGFSDLDLCVWDPVLGDFAFCFESPDAYEQGVFNIPYSGAPFHLVVASYAGDSEYRLQVECDPIQWGLSSGFPASAEAGEDAKPGHFDAYRPAPASDPFESPAAVPAWILELDLESGSYALHDALLVRAVERREEVRAAAVEDAP
jgi:hypothetical protein